MDTFAELMEEPAGGHNHGRRHAPEAGANREWQELGAPEHQGEEFMRDGGWGIVHERHGSAAGVTAHRGVLHPDEYVDSDRLREMVENELGFTYAEVHSVYRRGPVAGEKLALRSAIDARVLELAEAGGSIVGLGRALGFAISDTGHCRTLDNALIRARSQEDGSWA